MQVNSRVHSTKVINSFTKSTFNSRLCAVVKRPICRQHIWKWLLVMEEQKITQEEFKTWSIFVTHTSPAHKRHMQWETPTFHMTCFMPVLPTPLNLQWHYVKNIHLGPGRRLSQWSVCWVNIRTWSQGPYFQIKARPCRVSPCGWASGWARDTVSINKQQWKRWRKNLRPLCDCIAAHMLHTHTPLFT